MRDTTIQFSDKICSEPGCNKRIKQKIVEQNPLKHDLRCYLHHIQSTGNQGRREFYQKGNN